MRRKALKLETKLITWILHNPNEIIIDEEDKEIMDTILKRNNFMEHVLAGRKVYECFSEASKLIFAATFGILRDKYKNNVERNLARRIKQDSAHAILSTVLAAQVTNYLTGKSVDEVYHKAKEPLKSYIGIVKDVVPKQAILELNSDDELRKIIVHYLHFIQHIDWGFKETRPYLSSSQKAQVEYLLNNFGEDVPHDLDPDAFLILAKDFWMKYRSTLISSNPA